jgi:hypothetical protein
MSDTLSKKNAAYSGTWLLHWFVSLPTTLRLRTGALRVSKTIIRDSVSAESLMNVAEKIARQHFPSCRFRAY